MVVVRRAVVPVAGGADAVRVLLDLPNKRADGEPLPLQRMMRGARPRRMVRGGVRCRVVRIRIRQLVGGQRRMVGDSSGVVLRGP